MRNKIDYGIDLGTTNSAIARMENGVPKTNRTDMQKDIMHSCVNFNKAGAIMVGDKAYNALKTDSLKALETFEEGETNTYVEFKRTMGTTVPYKSKNMRKDFSSEELSAEVLKTLKSLVLDENIPSVVITVPAKFVQQQRDATMKAAKMAGFRQVQLLQEPVAAATAYGLTAKDKDSYWLVFDFGGGTFDAAIIKSEEGILAVKDTDGDNYLGGKDLDIAIVDKILLPELCKNNCIDSILANPDKKELLRKALKFFAEEAKNQLSYTEKVNVYADDNDLKFKDDNGNDPTINVWIDQQQLETVFTPIFQRAIDITKDLLKRNNLKGSDLSTIILVGGPTHSPILRRMLKKQITENVDTSVDPMTVVALGAAMYASIVDVIEDIKDETRDETKLQLELKYESASVETEELVNIKVLKNKSTGVFSNEIFAEIVRMDGGWTSSKTKIGEKPTLFEVELRENRSNSFNVNIYDLQGNRIECEPSQFNILQGVGGLDGMQVLPYNISIVKYFPDEEKDLIAKVYGLDKNKPFPVTGTRNDLKTRKTLRPGIADDFINIPIYEGNYYDDKSSPELNNLIKEIIITGENVPALLPEGSDVELTIIVDKSGLITVKVYFPRLEHTEEIEIKRESTRIIPKADELVKKIEIAKHTANKVNANDIYERLCELEKELENEKGSDDGKLKILDNLNKERHLLEKLEEKQEFPEVEQELKDNFYDFEDTANKLMQEPSVRDKHKVEMLLNEYRKKVQAIIEEKNKAEAKKLADELYWARDTMIYEITDGKADINRLLWHNENFNTLEWKDSKKARTLINQGLQMISNGETRKLRDLLFEIWALRINPEDYGNTLR